MLQRKLTTSARIEAVSDPAGMRRKLAALALGLALPFLATPAAQATAPAHPSAPANVVTPDQIAGYWCSGRYGWNSFESARASLDTWYPRNGRIWQAPDNTAVWHTWCHVTNSQATMTVRHGDYANAEIDPWRITLADETIVTFRATSASGGFTIDFNTTTHTQPFKVHVA